MTDRTYEQAMIVTPGICFECDGPGQHRHHVVPASRGGRRYVWLCERCHEKTHGYQDGHYGMMHAARRTFIASGGYGGGRRFGRKYGVELLKDDDGKLRYVLVPEEQEIIRRVCEERRSGGTLGDIARRLNAEKINTATGARWSRKTVRDLILRGPDALPQQR